ncbi:Ribosomal protein S18 acetylase RimI [Gemmobacter megaterium]|uniref:Ribosomal protein S18 acetylase RimI n=1 Tax=Gemmobacter megaterium TaxID=1086013 RepID=A0A1N7PP82_9RHOB|nr:GNAT family N-acetyltransferase [Gemmobacter megaterium]GGE20283.1 N-acetyltransferase [Gemmobacter megaterium]SIT12388.1 Ribosomal protein S18 acetylase RimI [Gemmobacter megaterium]
MIIWRLAKRDDVPQVLALLTDDDLGARRESEDPRPYFAAFDAMTAEGNNHLIVGEQDGVIIATYQLTFISGLSLRASRRAQVESVRVASTLRSAGIGSLLMADAEARARAAGCGLIQLTTNRDRLRAHAFYERQGYAPSHLGFKKPL